MNNKRWFQASVAVFAVMFVLEFLTHQLLLSGIYQQTASVWRPEPEMRSMLWLMWLGYAIFAAFFTWIYAKGHEPNKPALEQGLRFGLLIGLAFAPLSALAWYVVLPIPGKLAVGWLIFGLVKYIALGATVGLVYTKKQRRAVRKRRKKRAR